MTYCVAIRVKAGIVFCSDSRTNAGIDQVSTYRKMYRFGTEGERQFAVLNAGNLATTQGVIAKIKRDIKEEKKHSLMTVANVGEAADYIGELSVNQQSKHTASGATYEASFIVGGQVGDGKHQIALVYPQGNHITSSAETPYLQIGESKYGKPILDRILTVDTTLETAALCALVSMDSTMRSNLTVGPPIELQIYETDSLHLNRYWRFTEDSEYLRELHRAWDAKLTDAFRQLPPVNWSVAWDAPPGEQSGSS